MKEKEKSIYESALARGVSRRDFLKMCTALTAAMGLEFSQTDKVVKAMETNKRVPVIWLEMQDCTGCSESFIRSYNPNIESVLLDLISLEYSEVLTAAAGHQAEKSLQDVMKDYKGQYVLAVEGSIPENADYLSIGGKSAYKLLQEVAADAFAVIAYGSCSSYGGLPGASPNPTGALSVRDIVKDKPIINVPGCPPIAEVMTGVVAHVLTFGAIPELDKQLRPKTFYRHKIHDKCNRRAFFDAGLFVESFDDEGSKNGYCLYKMGCKGPTTFSSCAEMRWNGGVSFPIMAGFPCIGCTEENFWDNGPFYENTATLPGTQITMNPEKVGLAAAGVTVAGIAAHAAITGVKANKDKNDDKRGE
ncbi:MAG: hydrogenase small subunit [Vulcanibacillus sp.]